MKELTRERLALITARHAARSAERAAAEEGGFVDAFARLCDRLLLPLMQEFAAELRSAGHAPEIVRDPTAEPSRIELLLGLKTARGGRNAIGFAVFRRADGRLEVIAYQEVRPPHFDLARFAHPDDVRADVAEQLVLDAIEHLLACNAP